MKESGDQEQQQQQQTQQSGAVLRSHRLAKWSSLAVLILFTTTTSMVSQRSRAAGPSSSSSSYCVATSVLLSELLKLVVSFGLVTYQAGATTSDDQDTHALLGEHKQLHDEDMLTSASSRPPTWMEKVRLAYGSVFNASAWMMGVPALIYVAQNLLQLIANAHLSAVAYQGISQLKLVTAALISVCFFGKTLSTRQWLCMPLLMLGVLFLSRRPSIHSHTAAASVTTDKQADYAQLAYLLGIVAVVLSCICGSFAAVYIETRLKAHMTVSLAVRNAQLASFAAITASAALLIQAMQNPDGGLWSFNPLAGFNALAWSTVILRAAAGYVVSMTLRYADTIMKGFATSLAIITTISLESILKSSLPTSNQLIGAALVLCATYNYVCATAKLSTQAK